MRISSGVDLGLTLFFFYDSQVSFSLLTVLSYPAPNTWLQCSLINNDNVTCLHKLVSHIRGIVHDVCNNVRHHFHAALLRDAAISSVVSKK